MPRMRGAQVHARNHQALLQTPVKILLLQWTRALETRLLVSLLLWTGGRLVGSVNGPWHPDPSSSKPLYNLTSISAKARRRFS